MSEPAATAPPRRMKPRQSYPVRLAMHQRQLARQRSILAWMRSHTEYGRRPRFTELARLGKSTGFFPPSTYIAGKAWELERLWNKRAYYDSPEAELVHRCGQTLEWGR